MIDYNSPEEIAKRASQEDPIVMYLVVHDTLGMSAGKTAAQVGHAVGMLHIKQGAQQYSFRNEFQTDDVKLEQLDHLKIWDEWQNNSFRKVVLTANDSKWAKLKASLAELKIEHALVIDAGLTEIPSGSETVIGIWPMRKSQAPKDIKKLQVLK